MDNRLEAEIKFKISFFKTYFQVTLFNFDEIFTN